MQIWDILAGCLILYQEGELLLDDVAQHFVNCWRDSYISGSKWRRDIVSIRSKSFRSGYFHAVYQLSQKFALRVVRALGVHPLIIESVGAEILKAPLYHTGKVELRRPKTLFVAI